LGQEPLGAQWIGNHNNVLAGDVIAVNQDDAKRLGLRVGDMVGEYDPKTGKLLYSGRYEDTKGDPGVDNFKGPDLGHVILKKMVPASQSQQHKQQSEARSTDDSAADAAGGGTTYNVTNHFHGPVTRGDAD
jgi:hypothetical protein